MNIIDGRKIAASEKLLVQEMLKAFAKPPLLVIMTCDPNRATVAYLELKKKQASSLGIPVEVRTLPKTVTTSEFVDAIRQATVTASGVVVQLPIPEHLDTEIILDAILESHDVDNFRYRKQASSVLPPVVRAIDIIAKQEGVVFADARVTIFGAGRLVGAPALTYAKSKGAQVTVIDEKTDEDTAKALVREAQIIILGVGKPMLLTKEQVKPGVVVFDAGASEDGGFLVGDADPEVATVASVFTPVPGGIGPITIVALFRNLLELAVRQ